MISRRLSFALVATAALFASEPCIAQIVNPQPVPLAASASTSVPALGPFSGNLTEADGKLISGETRRRRGSREHRRGDRTNSLTHTVANFP